jgi:Fur family transcriptional regulator, ferric uptake regulator
MRNTAAKIEIQGLILNSSVALSHHEIQEKTKGLCDRVTIYRVLDRLVDDGIIHKIVNMDGVAKYAACHACSEKHKHNHVHFSCHKCKTVTCLENVVPSFNLPSNYTVSEINFTVSGVCAACA